MINCQVSGLRVVGFIGNCNRNFRYLQGFGSILRGYL